jgi:hypothetical protein
MAERTARTYQVTQAQVVLETSHARFTRAFESLLGRMPVEALGELPYVRLRQRLIAVEMTQHVARAGLYVPLRLFVEGVADQRVRVIYDVPSSLMAQFGSADVNLVARGLDTKVERILDETAKAAGHPGAP